MNAHTNSRSKIALGFGTAMAAVLLSACAAGSAPRADVSASSAERAMARGQHDRAIEHAEAATLAAPQNAAYRMMLGNAYLDAGRFASAETAFSDALTLGENTPRAALSLALAQIAQAKYAPAQAVLNEWDGQIATADFGLALALAGQPERGIHVMSNAIRGGENTVKMRQNLAYAFAMAGRWREARLMAQQDVPAGEVGARMEQWAGMVPSEAYQTRVAALLGVPVGVADSGQPQHLALGNNPSIQQLVAEAAMPPAPAGELAAISGPVMAPVPVPAPAPVLAVSNIAVPAHELAPAAQPLALAPASVPHPTEFTAAFAPVAQEPRGNASTPVVQPVAARQAQQRPAPAPARARAAAERPAAVATSAAADGSHLVQLGSFLSQQGARRAWNIYVGRYPELADREMVITEAVVRGRHYWRVSAGGYSQVASQSLCGRVRSAGEGCVTWAQNRPLPGAVDNGVRLARR